jgi:hypothetical protein
VSAGPWFGGLLRWHQRGARLRYTQHAGQAWELTRLTRADADDLDVPHGWHLSPGHGGVPVLHCGAHVARARVVAEAAILCGIPAADGGLVASPPTLAEVMAAPGLVVETPSGRAVALWPDAISRRIVARGYYRPGSREPYTPVTSGVPCGPIVAELVPNLTASALRAATEPAAIWWRLYGGAEIGRAWSTSPGLHSTWAGALAALTAGLAGGGR